MIAPPDPREVTLGVLARLQQLAPALAAIAATFWVLGITYPAGTRLLAGAAVLGYVVLGSTLDALPATRTTVRVVRPGGGR